MTSTCWRAAATSAEEIVGGPSTVGALDVRRDRFAFDGGGGASEIVTLFVRARTGVRVDFTASGATLERAPALFDTGPFDVGPFEAGGGGTLDFRLLALGACETGAADLAAAPRRLGGDATPFFEAGAFDRGPFALETGGGADARDLGARLRRDGAGASSTDGGGYESDPAARGAPARSEREDISSAAASTPASSNDSGGGG